MKRKNENPEGRIKSFLVHLESEAAILDRIAYKGKNQHRRAFYFQYLLKVRRDVKLLKLAGLEEILNYFQAIISSKKRKVDIDKHYLLSRLLGVARLLSQMVEPMIKAAIFVPKVGIGKHEFLLKWFGLQTLPMLLDVVSVFNMVSSNSQTAQSTVLNLKGVEVIREHHPSDNNSIALECVWETDKFVLLEKTSNSETKNQVKHVEDGTDPLLKSSNIQYQTIEAFFGGDELDCPNMDTDSSSEDLSGPTNDRIHATDASTNQLVEVNNEMEVVDSDVENRKGSPDRNFIELGQIASTSSFLSPELQTKSRDTVAFVPVGQSTSHVESGFLEKESC
ncbi:hypothetical protein IFM89_007448 [Coptis chinensis]|uniref:Nucleolus and neural progenitor protein-like N-terminal domain-containing protein n=1 Tax=Coptis chinensis TaxID=261450 RepID=A0A835I6E7_9MAGN|nr:hypothetical protein IFM89_007448 [Coptis chinensis]